MYQLGHYGAALIVYAPVGVLVALSGHADLAVIGGLVCVSLSTLPDCDHQLPFVEHRGPTHTVAFAMLVGAFLASVTGVLVDAAPAFAPVPETVLRVGASGSLDIGVVAFAFLVGTLSIGSHLLADALTPMGIRPFWPVSKRHYTFKITRAANRLANYVLFGLGVGAVLGAAAIVAMLG